MMNNLVNELVARGLVYQEHDTQYERCCILDKVYPWGFIIRESCAVLPDMLHIYDNKFHLICTLDSDDDDWDIYESEWLLQCTRNLFHDGKYYFEYHLLDGAPIHTEDVVAILLFSHDPNNIYDTTRLLITDSGYIYVKRDGYSLKLIDTYDIEDIPEYINDRVRHGYEVLTKDCHMSNLDMFNVLIVTNK